MHRAQEPRGVPQVVHGVEGDHGVERLARAEGGDILPLEPHVGQPRVGGLLPGPLDGVRGQVVTGERGRGKLPGQHGQGVTGAAAEVGDPAALAQPPGEPGYERQEVGDQVLVERVPVRRVHDVGELGAERLVGNPAAGPEAVRDRAHVGSDMRAQLAEPARLREPAPVRQAACSAGGVKVAVAAS